MSNSINDRETTLEKTIYEQFDNKTIDELMEQVRQGYITKGSVINIPNIFSRCSTKNHIEFLTSYGLVSPFWYNVESLAIIARIMNMSNTQILEYIVLRLKNNELSRSYKVANFVPYDQNIMKDLLWISCYIGSKFVAQTILSKGFKPEYGQWYDGEETPFPLIVACKYGHDEIIKLLIWYGAKYDQYGYYFGVGCMKLYLETKYPSIDVIKMLSSSANILYNLNAGLCHKDDKIANFFRNEYRKMGSRL
jgi:hypothetical protein